MSVCAQCTCHPSFMWQQCCAHGHICVDVANWTCGTSRTISENNNTDTVTSVGHNRTLSATQFRCRSCTTLTSDVIAWLCLLVSTPSLGDICPRAPQSRWGLFTLALLEQQNANIRFPTRPPSHGDTRCFRFDSPGVVTCEHRRC